MRELACDGGKVLNMNEGAVCLSSQPMVAWWSGGLLL